MNYYSLNGDKEKVSFKDAVVNSIAKDKGLYFPESIPQINQNILANLQSIDKIDACLAAIKGFVGEDIPEDILRDIISKTIDFPTPVKEVNRNIKVLELFHGPTLAFKDVGARFMALCLQYFLKQTGKTTTILVATSGDTGGAVANGFLGIEGINVIILYPKGKVSKLQEKQLTTLGQNITAIEIDGVFDDCQDLVKTAFIDKEMKSRYGLTSANSINVARWLPQMFYYINALQQVDTQKDIIFSVPSGNFGNICAGLMAQKIGFPIKHFIASTNVNNVVPRYLDNGDYNIKPTVSTISNAMDVSNPSNFVRIQELFGSIEKMKDKFSSYCFNDAETREKMIEIYKKHNYTLDPHGAVGYLGLEKHLSEDNLNNTNTESVFVETAHPVKFLEVVDETLKIKTAIPKELESLMQREKKSIACEGNYSAFKEILTSILC